MAAADIQIEAMYNTPDLHNSQLKLRRTSVRNAGYLPRENVLYVILSAPVPSGVTPAVTKVIDGVTYGRAHGMSLTASGSQGLFTRQAGFLCLAGLEDLVNLGWGWISEEAPFGISAVTGINPSLNRSDIIFSAPAIVSSPLASAASVQFRRMG